MELAHLLGLMLAGGCGGVCIGVTGFCLFAMGFAAYQGVKKLRG